MEKLLLNKYTLIGLAIAYVIITINVYKADVKRLERKVTTVEITNNELEASNDAYVADKKLIDKLDTNTSITNNRYNNIFTTSISSLELNASTEANIDAIIRMYKEVK
jgi:hypothetical protein